jgi:hypothetical protein
MPKLFVIKEELKTLIVTKEIFLVKCCDECRAAPKTHGDASQLPNVETSWRFRMEGTPQVPGAFHSKGMCS